MCSEFLIVEVSPYLDGVFCLYFLWRKDFDPHDPSLQTLAQVRVPSSFEYNG